MFYDLKAVAFVKTLNLWVRCAFGNIFWGRGVWSGPSVQGHEKTQMSFWKTSLTSIIPLNFTHDFVFLWLMSMNEAFQ